MSTNPPTTRDSGAAFAGTAADRPSALITNGLTKRYGGQLAVDALSVEVPAGVVAGFIGPNGAGKTTRMNRIGSYTCSN
jgi:ABC-type branched-subunit amino acid transport system ATPase component